MGSSIRSCTCRRWIRAAEPFLPRHGSKFLLLGAVFCVKLTHPRTRLLIRGRSQGPDPKTRIDRGRTDLKPIIRLFATLAVGALIVAAPLWTTGCGKDTPAAPTVVTPTPTQSPTPTPPPGPRLAAPLRGPPTAV